LSWDCRATVEREAAANAVAPAAATKRLLREIIVMSCSVFSMEPELSYRIDLAVLNLGMLGIERRQAPGCHLRIKTFEVEHN
jgi:hypothetical protein